MYLSHIMTKSFHEIRDPINVFIKYDSAERNVINSLPFQRLRHIHQLGMTYLLYPGATHRRFEHSLGVMELATRIYDVVINNIDSEVKEVLPQIEIEDEKRYWRRVLRMAALCHDLGHLPFSHVSETLLPPGKKHEEITVELIKSKEMTSIWNSMTPPLMADDIAKLAVGQKILKREKFNDWEAILSEIIVGDAFGVDRIDYLLRDSLHAGVMYGKFDHNRLIDTLRILPSSRDSKEPTLGVERGGIHAAEALLLARYFMFIQVYLHPIRRIYDLHLQDFLSIWLKDGQYPSELKEFLKITDNEITAEICLAARDTANKGYEPADRIVSRKHFKIMYQRNPDDLKKYPEPGKAIHEKAQKEFGQKALKHDAYLKEGAITSFPVRDNDGRILSSHDISRTIDFVFIDPKKRDDAKKWLGENRENILKEFKERDTMKEVIKP